VKRQGKSRLKLDPSLCNLELFFVRTRKYVRTTQSTSIIDIALRSTSTINIALRSTSTIDIALRSTSTIDIALRSTSLSNYITPNMIMPPTSKQSYHLSINQKTSIRTQKSSTSSGKYYKNAFLSHRVWCCIGDGCVRSTLFVICRVMDMIPVISLSRLVGTDTF
jgi:hypothetical protein